MKKDTTENSIPPITEGFKLKFDGTDTEYFVSPNKNIWVSKNFKQHMHPDAPLLKDVIWKLEPICGKWCIVGTETLELKEWGQFNNWMWVSVPK
jgi:hypothetical protein